ncbi:MAG: histidine kinase, partial [Pseudomonadota bacterium]
KVPMPFTAISIVGLILHEFAANATKHGAWRTETGKVTVNWRQSDDGSLLEVTWAEDGGPAVDADSISSGTGTAIVDRLLSAGQGKIERHWNETGLTATFAIPTRQE